MKNKLLKKLVSSLVISCLLFSSFGVAFGASTSATTDIKGHWAEAQISASIDKGFIKGYEDGSFKPGNNITRAEFMALINRSFGFTEETAISFTDVLSGNWAYPEVAKAVKAGYITGYANGTIGASKPISRQEVAVILDRLLGLSKTESKATAFTDSSTIASWAKDAVDAAVAKGILKGYAKDNSFKPSKLITRAEAVVSLERAVDAQSFVYNKAGTYGPTTGIETINTNVVVLVPGVSLQNMVINGDLLLGEGIGNGDAFLNNVTVTGTVTVQGGGENSIHFNNSVLVDVIIDKKSGTGIVRIVSEGSTTVALVVVNSPATLREMNTSGKGFSNVNISGAIPAGSKVTLLGAFNTVNVSSQQIQVDVPEGSIENFNVNAGATGITLNISEGAKINTLILDAIVKILGKGTIVAATVNIPGTTFQTPPQKTTTPTPAPVVVAPSSGGGGGTTTPTTPTTPDPTTPDPTTPTTPDPTTPTTPPVVLKGTVTGSVYRISSQDEQIAGVTVSVYSGIQGSGSLVSTVESEADGKYSISNVPAGNYYLTFMMTGYMDLTVTPANHTISGNTTTDASTAYMYHNLVKGYVKDTSGNPIKYLSVNIYDNGDTEYEGYTNTADDGSFYFYDVPALDTLHVNIEETGLFVGKNIEIGSLSLDRETDIGTIELNSRNKQLSALSLSGITLTSTFSPNNYSYYATEAVPFSMTNTTISFTPTYKNTSVHINNIVDGAYILNEGYNTIQLYVTAESGDKDYYEIYSVQVYRETEAETLAKADAIAAIEAFNESTDMEVLYDLNTATGLDTAVNENHYAYKVAIIAAADGALDTSEEIATLVASVNHKEDKRLISLNLSGITFDQEFSPEVYHYTATVSSSVTSTTILATTMNPNASIHLNYDQGIKILNEGHMNQVQVYVNPESGGYYDIYTVDIFRESGVDQLAAIEKIEAVTDSAESISIDDLIKATGKDIVIAGNIGAYRTAIVSAIAGSLDTVGEVESLVYYVNEIVYEEEQGMAIAKIEAAADMDSAELISLDELNIASSSDIAVAENLQAYWSAIIVAPNGALDSSYEIRILLEKVNAVVEIEAFDGSTEIENTDLRNLLNAATGLYTASSDNIEAYKSAILAAENGALDTSEEIAALVSSINNVNVPIVD
jgi:hypothetical protein